MYKEGA